MDGGRRQEISSCEEEDPSGDEVDQDQDSNPVTAALVSIALKKRMVEKKKMMRRKKREMRKTMRKKKTKRKIARKKKNHHLAMKKRTGFALFVIAKTAMKT